MEVKYKRETFATINDDVWYNYNKLIKLFKIINNQLVSLIHEAESNK